MGENTFMQMDQLIKEISRMGNIMEVENYKLSNLFIKEVLRKEDQIEIEFII
jgi:hypothetical protein